jgi:hypothetical protein
MLGFLVTSKARRRLLQLLWGSEQAGSAAELARLARVGFASAYRELRAMHSLGLVHLERKNGAVVYRANPDHPARDTLRTLTLPPAQTTPSEEARRVRRQLKALGAPLHEESHDGPCDDVEAVMVRGVALARRDPDVARALPVCLYRQRDALRPQRLRHHALQLGEKRALAFLLDLTAELSRDGRFAVWAARLRDGRCKTALDFFSGPPRSRRSRQTAELQTPAVARRWGFRMNMGLDAFQSTFDKFAYAA